MLSALKSFYERITNFSFKKIPPDTDKSVYFKIPLYRFHFMHEPNRSSSEGEYIGRDKIRDNLLAILNDGRGKSGTYLISGYRGAGKTSFVKTVLYDYEHGAAFTNKSFLNYVLYFFKGLRGRVGVKVFKIKRYLPRLLSVVIGSSLSLIKSPLLWIIAFLFLCPPCGESLLSNLVILFFAIMFYLFVSKIQRDGLSKALNFKRAIGYRFFRPVVKVNINLGHESLDAKTLLFNMSSLLRSKCKKARKNTLYFIGLVLVFYFSTVISKNYSDMVSGYINSYIFSAYYLDDTLKNIDYSSDENVKKIIDKSLEEFEKELQYQSKNESGLPEKNYHATGIESFYSHIYLNNEDAKNRLYELNNGLLLPKKGLHIFDRKIQFLLDAAKTNSHFMERDRVSKLCKIINTVKNKEVQNMIDSAGFLHVSYCFLNSFDESMINFLNSDKELDEEIQKIRKQEDNYFYLFGKKYDAFGDVILSEAGLLYFPVSNLLKWFNIGTFELFRSDKEGYSPPQNLIFIFVFLMASASAYFLFKMMGFNRFIRKLDYLHERIIYSTSTESNTSPLPWLQSFVFKKTKITERLDTRQIEELLLDALEHNRSIFRLMPQADIIFIFDELDKITPQTQENRFSTSQIEQARQRKQQIEALLGSLKNFITIAPARFIFIGGRDMYDTNLVEQISPNRIHGSMFDAIIYVPSFLTDDSDGVGEDISSMIEQYVCRRLLPSSIAYYLFKKKYEKPPETSYEVWSLGIYEKFLCDVLGIYEKDASEVRNFLQKFIYYLTYRSAGCVQRLSYHFERFFETDKAVINSVFEYEQLPNTSLPTHFYLGFDERQQYKVEMIANLFVILHAEANQLIRQFGDKLMLSTFSLLDYILKYHNMGFNSLDIERAPEMLDIYRTPSLPGLIDYFLNHVLKPYLRPIKNGLFEYRFVHSFQAEIAYISYFSEQEMAAFNFSLDESIHTKQHFMALLKAAKGETPEHLRQIDGSMLLESDVPVALPFIHQSLGDLCFLDKQYPEALMEYRLALQQLTQAIDEFQLPFAEIGNGRKGDYNPYPIKNYVFLIIAYLRILLKMILASEIRKQYDYAIALCSQAERTIQHFMKGHLGKRFLMPNMKILPLIIQPYLCLAFIHLKKNPSAASANNLIDHIIDRLDKNFSAANANLIDNLKKFKTEESNIEEIKSYIYIKAGDLCLAQSKFGDNATASKDCTVESCYKKALSCLSKKDIIFADPDTLSELGYIYMGLGHAKFVRGYNYFTYSSFGGNKFILVESKNDYIGESLVNKSTFVDMYILSAKAYEQAGRYADAFLALWSLLFLCVYAANDRFDLSKIKDFLKTKMNYLDKLSFKYGYGLNNKPYESPFLKSANVMFSYLEDTTGKKQIDIRKLNGFPVETKILACYLKAKTVSADKDKSINLYIRAIEESMVYIGTQEYVFPHPVLMYRDLVEILDKSYEKNKKLFGKNINKNLEKYLNKEYCETQKNVLAKAMINRHKPSEDFDKYVEKKYYLNDSFSDPYLNTLWVADYILSRQFESK